MRPDVSARGHESDDRLNLAAAAVLANVADEEGLPGGAADLVHLAEIHHHGDTATSRQRAIGLADHLDRGGVEGGAVPGQVHRGAVDDLQRHRLALRLGDVLAGENVALPVIAALDLPPVGIGRGRAVLLDRGAAGGEARNQGQLGPHRILAGVVHEERQRRRLAGVIDGAVVDGEGGTAPGREVGVCGADDGGGVGVESGAGPAQHDLGGVEYLHADRLAVGRGKVGAAPGRVTAPRVRALARDLHAQNPV